MPVSGISSSLPAWCSDRTPVMWSSTTTTSSTLPCHCFANMPMVAEPQPTRMRSSGTPLTVDGGATVVVQAGYPPIVNGVPEERSEEHTSELQSLRHLVCRLLLEKKKKKK